MVIGMKKIADNEPMFWSRDNMTSEDTDTTLTLGM